MPRPLRIQSAGFVHHVISLGNDGQTLFKTKEDYLYYVDLLDLARKAYPINIYNYVLLESQIHILVEPINDGSLSKFMEYVSKQYAKYFNQKQGRRGHVFQGRYKSILIQADRYFFSCSRYMDLSPVKTNLVTDPIKYSYSGYNHLASGGTSFLNLDKHELYKNLGSNPKERQIAYRALVFNYPGDEIDFMQRRAGILGDKEFKEVVKNII